MATIVSYIKHWDNDTKGTIEFGFDDVTQGFILTQRQLVRDAVEEGVDLEGTSGFDKLFTITKAEVGESSNWTGVPA